MTKQEFFDKFYSTAVATSDYLGGKLDPNILLSFWHWETAGGTNKGSQDLNNLAGIKWVNQKQKYNINASKSGMYANYASLDEFAKDYARVLSLGYYKDVLTAGTTAGYTDDVLAINKSPYAEADYSIKTVVDNALEFKQLSGQPVNIDNKEYISIPSNGMSKEDILKAIAIGVAFLATIKLLD